MRVLTEPRKIPPRTPCGSCDTVTPGQTLITERVLAEIEDVVDAAPVGHVELEGFGRPIAAYEIRGFR